MKYSILFIYIFFWSNLSFSQTYLTPSIGYDFMDIKPVFKDFGVESTPYSIKGLQYGLEIEQILYKKWSASAYLVYVHRKIKDYYNAGIVGYDGFLFNSWRSNFLINYRIKDYLALGIGYDYNILKESNYTVDVTKPISLKKDRGLNFSIRGFWKNIELRGYYHYGLNQIPFTNWDGLSSKPIHYFGVSVGYRIKVLNAFKKKNKIDCPTVR